MKTEAHEWERGLIMKRVEHYLDWLATIAGDNGRLFNIDKSDSSHQLFIVKYDALPEDGYSTSYSYGLSSMHHPEWIHSKPELLISVNSLDTSWGLAMGEVLRQRRRSCLFECGTVIDFNEQISEESRMSAFVVFANALYDAGEAEVCLPDGKVSMSQLYPIYDEEISVVSEIGVERFMGKSGLDFFDVSRRPYKGEL